jgi:hypothetical protein
MDGALDSNNSILVDNSLFKFAKVSNFSSKPLVILGADQLIFQRFKLSFLLSANILEKFNGFRKLIYGGLSLTFTSLLLSSLEDGILILPLAIRHLRDDRDERDEDRWLRVLGGSSSLEESSQVLSLVSILPLLLSFLGSAIDGQLSLKWPFSPHANHPLFFCFFLSMLKRRSSTCRGIPIRLILRIILSTFLTHWIVSSSSKDDVHC